LSETPLPEKVGELSQAVIDALGLGMQAGQEILLGETNIFHMQSRHPATMPVTAIVFPIFLPPRTMWVTIEATLRLNM